jgi:hypothetical protein
VVINNGGRRLCHLRGCITESLRVPNATFRQFDDFPCCGSAERIDPPSPVERHEGHLVSDA